MTYSFNVHYNNLPPACNCTPGVMWMNSGLLVILEPQINPITKSDCSSAIFSWEGNRKGR